MIDEFRHPLASRLALVGAFGYDLLFQFDPIKLKLPRHDVKDLHLYLCDDIYFMDRKKEQIERFQYDFSRGDLTTHGLKRTAARLKKREAGRRPGPSSADHEPEEYMANVETVREGMRRGRLLRSRPAADILARRIRAARRNYSGGSSTPAPVPTNFSCNSATSN